MSFLEEPTLVLNRWWSLVTVTTAADAICKLYCGTAHAIESEDYSVHDFESWLRQYHTGGHGRIGTVRVIRTPRLALPIPEIILLTRYDKIPRREISFSRHEVFRRDQYRCQYCGHRENRGRVTLDHVVPKSRGGSTGWTNCVSCCPPCNTRKGNRTPREARMRLLSKPVKPSWTPSLLLEGYKTPKASWRKFIS